LGGDTVASMQAILRCRFSIIARGEIPLSVILYRLYAFWSWNLQM
jgi:hypothetical protein